MSSLKTPKLPMPSCCGICHTTIHAALVRDTSRGEHTFSRRQVVVWFHDATLATIVRRGGVHDAVPDPTYAPARARVITLAPPSAVEATRDWRVMPLAA